MRFATIKPRDGLDLFLMLLQIVVAFIAVPAMSQQVIV